MGGGYILPPHSLHVGSISSLLRNPESHFCKLYKESQHEGQGGENGGSNRGSQKVGLAGEPLLEGEELEEAYDEYEDESDE